ncbi:hypothetical protein [Streptomyces sp. NPDC007100]|uniref:hypothetical protein n=1 Tax=Streptomyces sp. NPDC007100 TaxID=3155602 RepID=UPI0033D508A9
MLERGEERTGAEAPSGNGNGGRSEDADASYVAVCPVTPELARQIVSLTDLRWDGEGAWEAGDAAMRALGWRDDAETELSFMARFVTGTGHHVYDGDRAFLMPFTELYEVGPDCAFTEDSWGGLPGWTSRKGAGRAEYDAHFSDAVGRFRTLLGPPELDAVVRDPDVPGGQHRYTGWRRGGNVLLLGQGTEPCSYHSNEEARVVISPLPADGGFPPAGNLYAFCQF